MNRSRSLLASLAMSVRTTSTLQTSKSLLRGVVFDMDGTLTKPNLNFDEMYRRCGVSLSKDILKEITIMPPQQQLEANKIIEEIEEEGRCTLELMPGALEMITWCFWHQIPMALVTRNTQKTVQVLLQRLLPDFIAEKFHPIITREDGFLPKPDPSAMHFIANQWSHTLPCDNLLMVGDSFSNDIVFGKRAGVCTVLLDTKNKYEIKHKKINDSSPDFVIDKLDSLPALLWSNFDIEGRLGTGANNLHGLHRPEPSTDLTKAAYEGDLQSMKQILSATNRINNANTKDESGNTALIWAADMGHANVVDFLLSQSNIHVDSKGYLGATAVSRAAKRGYCDILKLLIQSNANLDIPNDKMQYPLHFAAFKQHPKAVALLLRHGCNPRVLDRKGRNPAQDTSSLQIRDCILQATI